MSDPLGPESLSTTTDVVLAIRFVLSQGARSVRGVLVDPEAGRDRPFVGIAGLCEALGDWLADAQRDAQELARGNTEDERPRNGSGRTDHRRD